MAVKALSENWLFKEMGDTHWELICKGLNTKSFDLKNETEDRLYATFVRIRINCDKSLKHFTENEDGIIEGGISRFGNSMYFSNIDVVTDNNKIKAELMTTFSIRKGEDNKALSKSEPHGVENEVAQLPSFPQMGNDYRLLKKRVKKELTFGDYAFDLTEDSIYSNEYRINAFYDINGVNLLYFASYPIINDYSEGIYFNDNEDYGRWEQTYYTKYKDVFYYANCDINETIIYKLNNFKELPNGDIQISSTLCRKSDDGILARIFSVKSKN